MLVPKLLTTLRGYDRRPATADITAGVIVGVVALPLAYAREHLEALRSASG